MYNISDKYKIACKALTRQSRTKIVIDNITYDGSKYVKDYPKFSHSNETMIGGFPIKSAEFSLWIKESSIDVIGKKIKIYRGLIIDNQVEWIPQGVFFSEEEDVKTSDTGEYITVKCYDKAKEMGTKKYIDNNTYPISETQYIKNVITSSGYELDLDCFVESNYIMKQKPNMDSNTSVREIVSRYAEQRGAIALFSRVGKVQIKRPMEIDFLYKFYEYKKFTCEKSYGALNQIIIGNKDISNNIIYPDGKKTFPWTINDNPFLDLVKLDRNIEIYNQIKGLKLTPFTLESALDCFYLDINDVINIYRKDGTLQKATVLSIKTENRLKCKISANVQTNNGIKYELAGSIKKDFRELRFDVDYNKNQIEALVSDTTENAKNIEDLRTPILTKEGNNHLCLEEAYETNAIEYNIIGKCEQIENLNPYEIKTIRGIKNLFNINHLEINDFLSVTSKIEKNALILTNSDNNANSYIRYKLFNTNEKERKTYTFSCYAKTNGNNLARVNIFYADENGNNRSEIANTNATKEGILKCTFTLNHSFNENQKNILILFYGSYNAGNLKDTLATYTDIQLEESSIAHSYVPYGSWLKSKVLSKNLANIANFNVSANHAWKNIFDVVDNTEYTLSFIKSRISDVPIVNNSINQIGEIRYYHNETLLSSIVIPLPYVTISSGSHKTIYLFVTPDKCNNIAIDFTNNNGDGNLNTMVSNIQLEESQEATEYESFQEKEIFVDINKPNLFNFLNIINKSNINANGEIVEDPSQAFDINFIKVIPKKKYKLVSDYERQFVLSFYKDIPKIGSVGTSRIVKNNIFTETVTVPEDYNYLAIRHGMDALTTEDNSKLKIYEGLDSYYELNSIKEVADSLEVNHGILEKRIGKIILDGTTGIFTLPNNSNENFIQINLQIPNIEFQCSSVGDEFLCTHFLYYEKATSTGKEREGLKLFNSGNYYAFVFSVSTTIATTIEEFKNWLKENPITIYYILKEPETIHLTPTKIPLFENENHLTLLDDIETKTDIKYHRIHAFNEAFYTKEEADAQLEIKANEINLGVESNKTELKNGFLEVNEKLGNYALQQTLIEQINSVLAKITDSEARISILNQTIQNGVPITKTETGYTFDINGLNISSTDAEVNSTLSSLGLSILDNISKEVLLYAGYDKDLQETIVKARNMIIEKYFTVAHCRIEEFKDPVLGIGTGFFYVE